MLRLVFFRNIVQKVVQFYMVVRMTFFVEHHLTTVGSYCKFQ